MALAKIWTPITSGKSQIPRRRPPPEPVLQDFHRTVYDSDEAADPRSGAGADAAAAAYYRGTATAVPTSDGRASALADEPRDPAVAAMDARANAFAGTLGRVG